MNKGKAVQIVQIDNHKFLYNIERFSNILQNPEVRNRKVVVVSVAGAFRKGKSFLLSFFLRYLYSKYEAKDTTNWLGMDDDILEGFSWKGGPDPHTTGILMWSHLFLHGEGDQAIAIILLDTQGVFDCRSTVKDCAFIFAISTLLSSVQIYNISGEIQEDHLQHLQLFTEYGRLVEGTNHCKPFQLLQFLIRDWYHSKYHSYGKEGGKEYLKKTLQIKPGLHDQLRSVREHIYSSFSEIECYLMPHPGLKVASNPSFEGQLRLIDESFKEHIKILTPLLLAPENLRAKKINGKDIRAIDLIIYFKSYVDVLIGDSIPNPTTIADATANANHMIAFNEANNLYHFKMKKIVNNAESFAADEFKWEHGKMKGEVLNLYKSKKKMGSPATITKYEKNLEKSLDESFKIYESTNNDKFARHQAQAREDNLKAKVDCIEYYKREMDKLLAEKSFLEDEIFFEHHSLISNNCIQKMKSLYKKVDTLTFDKYRIDLGNELNTQHIFYKTKNDRNKKAFQNAEEWECNKSVNVAKDVYSKGVKEKVEELWNYDDLLELHRVWKDEALLKFKEMNKEGNRYAPQYNQILIKEISESYNTFAADIRQRKETKDAKTKINNLDVKIEAKLKYSKNMDQWLEEKKLYATMDDLKKKHCEEKTAALEEFELNSDQNCESFTKYLETLIDDIERDFKLMSKARKDPWMCTIL